MAMRAPLPVRDGVGPTRLRVPRTGPWETVADYVTERFSHIDPEILLSRFDRGEVVAVDGSVITRRTPLGAEDFIWYYREPPDEPAIPYEVMVRHVDDDLLVVDKPHFLPTTPGGGFLQNSALVRLRREFDNPDLTPIHRLDRATAGLVMFSIRPATRGAYQSLFADRAVEKVYEAVTTIPETGMPELPRVVRSHLTSTRGSLRAVAHEDREPNAETRVEAIRVGATTAHVRLYPRTGRMHQLRAHLAGIGLGILGDRFYPDLLDEAPDDPARPLQLLARELRFVDPLSGTPREFTTGLTLREAPRV
ncbi:pseudouridine synthase [Microbacterium oleivorans]|uniref:pseudouridine synthase n=1 Tax=Microbacterium oleivorans TaxID=273677 RepID=UPI000A6016C0|nr:pseudouridine synthase [Microbacterium oleivorans]